MNIPWEDVRLFLAVAETRSMSAAARQLRIGQPTISRRLAMLESELGYPLFRRTTNGASLTAAGERLVESARKMAEWAGELNRAATTNEKRPRGVVRLTAPPGVAWSFCAPFAAWLKQKQPGLQLELLSSHQFLDLARGEADLALRIRPSTQNDLKTVATLRSRGVAMATREYIRRLPRRYSFADVGWICWAPPYDRLAPNPQLEQAIANFAPVFTSDSLLIQWRAAEAGVGALILDSVRHRFSGPTNLVPLKLDLGPEAVGAIHLVCAKSALDIPRVRVVAELLAEELKRAGGVVF